MSHSSISSSDMPSKGNTITLDSNQTSGARKQVSPAKRWCFTAFKFDEFWEDKIRSMFHEKDKYIVGLEICPKTLRKHLQGYVEFENKCRPLKQMQSHFEGCHLEKAKGDRRSNIKYCSKDGNFIVRGFDLHKFECSAKGIIAWWNSCQRNVLLYYGSGDVPARVVFRTHVHRAVFMSNEIELPQTMTSLRNATEVAYNACLCCHHDFHDMEYSEALDRIFDAHDMSED